MVLYACHHDPIRIAVMDQNTERVVLNEWGALDEQIATLKSTSESVAKSILKMKEAVIEGSLRTYQDLDLKLQSQLTEMNSKISAIGGQVNALSASNVDLQETVEKLCKEQMLSEQIFKTGNYLVVYPLVVRFERRADAPLITVGSTSVTSIRPDFIVKQIKESLESPFNPKVLIKNLRAAFGLLKRSDKQQEVSLEDIRQLISISHDSTSKLSVEQFGALLQRLYSTSDIDLKAQMPRFIPVAAASQSYLLFKDDGSSISVGSISFDDIYSK
jgi:hypothetical protein